MTTDPQRYSFSVNAQPGEVMASPKTWLMDVIRDELRLTGTKDGWVAQAAPHPARLYRTRCHPVRFLYPRLHHCHQGAAGQERPPLRL